MAKRADAFVEIVMVMGEQLRRRRKGQKCNGGERQNEDEFLSTSQHKYIPLHLQDVALLRDHFIQHRVDEKSEQ
jgi:hypothetical protein